MEKKNEKNNDTPMSEEESKAKKSRWNRLMKLKKNKTDSKNENANAIYPLW